MASVNISSCSPSSSAVTIPIPGKSILKRPPPTQQSLLSRITRSILPTQHQTSASDDKPLKRAHFILPQLVTVYPISSLNPPSTPTLKEEKRAVEDREAERRRRVVRANSVNGSTGKDPTTDWWSLEKVESFYRECCTGCDEQPDPAISTAFKRASPTNPRSVDFSGIQLNVNSSSILSDVFTIEWGLRKLVFRECDLDEHKLKPMLHALLIPGTLSFLSVASNRLKAPAFRLIGAYVSQAKSLQFLDLSQNNLDKKSIEYIITALATPPDDGLVSLRLDDCSLRPAALEALSRAVRTSSLRNISLRHNKINAAGAVALALMIRDYPDIVPSPAGTSSPPTIVTNGSLTPSSSVPPSPASSNSSLPLTSPPQTPITSSFTQFPKSPPASQTTHSRAGPILPPPRHPPTGPQTTYTPYIPRSRRARPGQAMPNPLSPTGQPIPIITSSSQGGVTTRHPIPSASSISNDPSQSRHSQGPSAALLDKVRALDALPRVGALRTLDLKGNDLRTGITYLAQVLKRNRTLKVLNLSENKLDVQCLVAIAEALKYNSCLETLDLSKNPCSGPGLEGIQSLRTAFTLNTALKRLFLSSTSMTSDGAIALAEFLPESTSLLHLDLTLNNLDLAGVMALSSGLKANHTMRCLDLNIPPDDEEFARMCRDILNSCVRNTEEAERNTQQPTGTQGTSGRGLGKGVWGMIEESELAKSIRMGEEKQIDSDVVVRARECITQLQAVVTPTKHISSPTTPTVANPTPERVNSADLLSKAKSIISELTELIQAMEDPGRMEELLDINDELTELVSKVPLPKPSLSLEGLGLKWNDQPQSPNLLDSLPSLSNNSRWNEAASGNGHVEHGSLDEEPAPTTPRIDKGKAKAEPEPEEPEKVLSPTLVLPESESEDEDGPRYPVEECEDMVAPSPTDRSRIWVAEEGEIFRKGAVLLGPEEMEGEYAGEELRKELLEAMVERPPPRPLLDEYGVELSVEVPTPERETSVPLSPQLGSPDTEKPPPRPYVSRSRSSSSIRSTVSTTLKEGGDSPQLHSPQSATFSPRSPTRPDSPSLVSPAPRPYLERKRSPSNAEVN